MSMAVSRCLKDLIGELLHGFERQWTTNLSHILFHVIFAILEDQVKVVILVDYFFKSVIKFILVYKILRVYLLYNIRVFDTLE